MTIVLDGSKGISIPDGTVSEPSIRGSSGNTGIFYTNNDITFTTGGVERFKVAADGTIVANGGIVANGSPLTIASGTVSAPSLTVIGDTNTGLFFPAADTIAFTEGGVERLRLASNGQIGIGGENYGSNGEVLTSRGSNSPPVWTLVTPEIVRVERTSNVLLGTSNRGNLIDITSGTFTQTFDASATLGSGWFCYIRNNGSGDITLDPNGAETIDGLTSFIMYPGEVRLVQCTGSNLQTIVLDTFYRIYTASGTFVKPPGYSLFGFDAIGGGGGGGRPSTGSAGTSAGGGSGGGRFISKIEASLLGASETIAVGAGGIGASANATDGGTGGNTSIGSYILATGGGGGSSSNTFPSSFLGGGAALVAHEGPFNDSAMGFAGGADQRADQNGLSAEYGGGSGGSGSSQNGSQRAGGSSIFGGAGGGGGSSSFDLTPREGGFGGVGGSFTPGGGAAGGAGTTTITAGTAGAAGNLWISGSGGGGGGSNSTTGSAGGAGGIPGGGGGGGGKGGGTLAGSAGFGGAGARGELRIWGIV